MRLRATTRTIDGRPVAEWGWRNGVRVHIRRTKNGSTVEATCTCLGLPGKTHSDIYCPNLSRREGEA